MISSMYYVVYSGPRFITSCHIIISHNLIYQLLSWSTCTFIKGCDLVQPIENSPESRDRVPIGIPILKTSKN